MDPVYIDLHIHTSDDPDRHIVINLCLGIEIAESEDEKFFICDSM